MSQFKQCPNGHYYQGDNCPYCKTYYKNNIVKICNNHHAYTLDYPYCPICDSPIDIDKYDPSGDTMELETISLNKTIRIKIKQQYYHDISQIIITKTRGNKIGYCFAPDDSFTTNEFTLIDIDPTEEIQIEGTNLKAKEFIKICDIIKDNELEIKG